MGEIIYQVGIPDQFKEQAVALYDEAFGRKISVAIEDDAKRREVLSSCFVLEHAISALSEDRLVGIAGLHTGKGSLTGGAEYKDLVSMLGFIQGNIAALLLSLYERKPRQGELVMDGITVLSGYRGRGIGGVLLDKVKEYALQNGFRSIRLDVIDTNPRAKVLYERNGFKAVKREEFPYLKKVLGFGGSETMTFNIDVNAQ
ncbi:MAG: GNAT family N-acetyltransferase [Candidatus Thiodiazotropha sp.]|uniref:GNAT family N-acetyltransferase n=1 Tax=Candidatus Thiodiazotropha taylori TaxID=2792791 RepID=A0A944M8V7_9GAMM|nr:GNAT family N-acetyltransferase [Candidatus Thiodiazotropha taylori]